MLSFVLKNSPLKLCWVPGYSDYYPETAGGKPTGRSVEPKPFNARKLGPDEDVVCVLTGAGAKWPDALLEALTPRELSDASPDAVRAWIDATDLSRAPGPARP